MADVQQLLVQIDATTEVLRRELKRAEQPLGQFEAKSKATTTAQDQLAAAMRRNAQAIAVLQGPLGAISGRFSSLGALIGAVNPLIAASTVAVAAFATTLGKAVTAAENFERATLKTEAILRATGSASGQTTDSIRQMSREIARATLASVQGVESAAQKLLTFRSVTGATFRQTLELSQDLAEVGFGSIETAVVQLGKALEDPEKGMTALTRVGVSFSEQQKEVIKTLYESGDVLGAQEKLLEAVAVQVGGAGRAASGGLTGAYDSLGQSAEELLEKIGRTSGALAIQRGIIDFLDASIRGMDLAIFGDTTRDLISLENDRLQILEEISASERAGNAALAEADRQRLKSVEDQIRALIRLQEAAVRAKKSSEDAAQANADAARASQDSDRAQAVEGFVAALREQIEVEKISDADRGKRQAADKAEADARKQIAGLTAEQIKRIREIASATEAERQALKKSRDEANEKAKEDLRMSEMRKETLDDLEQERRHQERLRDAHEQGAAAVEDVEDAYEALQIVRKLKLDSDGEEAKKIVELVVEINKQKRAIESIKTANKDAQKAAEDLSKAQQKAAKEAADAYAEVLDRIRDFSEEALGDSFFDILRGETVDFAEFFETTILRALANVLAAAATQQIVVPIATSVVGAAPGLFGLSPAASAVAQQAGGGILGDFFSPITSAITQGFSAATGGISAALFGTATVSPAAAAGVAAIPGGLSMAGTGGTAGLLGAGGAANVLGPALAGALPWLAAGAIAIPLLTGMFGRKPSVGPTGVARLPDVIDGTRPTELTSDNKGDPSAAAAVAQQIRDVSRAAAESLGAYGSRAYGLDIGSFPQPESGNSQRAGFNLKEIIDNVVASSDLLKGVSAEKAVTEGVRQTLQKAFDGFPKEEVSTALRNSAAEVVADLLSDLDFANTYQAMFRPVLDAAGPLRTQLDAMRDSFEAARDRAQGLGLATDTLAANFAAAQDGARLGFRTALTAEAAGVGREFTELTALALQLDQLTTDAEAAGVGTATLAQVIDGRFRPAVEGLTAEQLGALITAFQAVAGEVQGADIVVAELTESLGLLSDTAADTAEAVADAAAIAAERQQLQIRLAEAQGDATGALALRRAEETAAVDASNRALLAQIHALEDQAAAATAAADAARALDIGMYERLINEQETRLEHLEAEREELERLSSSAGQAARALRAASQGFLTDPNFSPLNGLERVDEARRQFQDALSLANDTTPNDAASQDALNRLPDLSRTLLESSRAYYASSEDYLRDFNLVQQALNNTAIRQESIESQQLAQLVGINASIQAMTASISGLSSVLANLNNGITPASNPNPSINSLITGLNQDGLTGTNDNAVSTVARAEAYLANNPDVAAAIARGDFGDPSAAISGALRHYSMFGANEGRTFHTGGFPLPGETFRALPNEIMVQAPSMGQLRVFDPMQSAAMRGGDNGALIEEIRALRQEVSDLKRVAAITGSGTVKAVERGNEQRGQQLGMQERAGAAPKPRKVAA